MVYDQNDFRKSSKLSTFLHLFPDTSPVKITVTDMDNAWLEVIVLILSTTDIIIYRTQCLPRQINTHQISPDDFCKEFIIILFCSVIRND